MATKRTTTGKPFRPQTFGQALAEAQGKLDPRPEGADRFVELRIKEIAERTELFQPRRFIGKNTPLDMKHVKTLQKMINNGGELDPS